MSEVNEFKMNYPEMLSGATNIGRVQGNFNANKSAFLKTLQAIDDACKSVGQEAITGNALDEYLPKLRDMEDTMGRYAVFCQTAVVQTNATDEENASRFTPV